MNKNIIDKNIIDIMQYKEYKKEFEFDIISEIDMLKRTEKITFNKQLKKDIKDSLNHIIDSYRPQSHRENTIIIAYVKHYLLNFTANEVGNFDTIYNHVKSDPKRYIGVKFLRELNEKNRRLAL